MTATEPAPTLYRCCSSTCPGLPWRASDQPHPVNCGVLTMPNLSEHAAALEGLADVLTRSGPEAWRPAASKPALECHVYPSDRRWGAKVIDQFGTAWTGTRDTRTDAARAAFSVATGWRDAPPAAPARSTCGHRGCRGRSTCKAAPRQVNA